MKKSQIPKEMQVAAIPHYVLSYHFELWAWCAHIAKIDIYRAFLEIETELDKYRQFVKGIYIEDNCKNICDGKRGKERKQSHRDVLKINYLIAKVANSWVPSRYLRPLKFWVFYIILVCYHVSP